MGSRSIGRANIIPARSKPKNSTLVRAYLSCSFFHAPICPSFCIFTKDLCTVENEGLWCSSWFESSLQPFFYFLPCYLPQYHRVQSKVHSMELWKCTTFLFYLATSLLFSWCTASDLIVSTHYVVTCCQSLKQAVNFSRESRLKRSMSKTRVTKCVWKRKSRIRIFLSCLSISLIWW